MVKFVYLRVLLACAALSLAACTEPAITGITPADSVASTAADDAVLPSTTEPRLLRCPTFRSATTAAIIGPLGGLLQLRGSEVSLPLGAVTVPTLMRLTVPASRFMEIEVTANDLPTFLFQTPVTITIDYSRCWRSRTEGLALTVWHIDSRTKALLENMGGTDDKVRRRITFTTGHLSSYAIAH